MTTARQQVQDPSIQAALFQCRSLLTRLAGYCLPKYPENALHLRDLFAILAEQVEERLWAIHQARGRDEHGQVIQPLTDAQAQNVIQLGEVVQTIHALLRYIEASKPPATPPEIQTAISALVSVHVPQALRCDPKEVLVLVRPQWEYSLKYVNPLQPLERIVDFSLLDPEGQLGADNFRSFLERLWQARRQGR